MSVTPKSLGLTNREAVLKEIIKCGKDPVYFIKRYAKIQHPRKGLIPFETYPFQDDCVADFEKHRFNIVLKSRQLGLSTVTAAYATWYALFKKDKNILVIATKLTTAMNFIRKCKVIIDNVPRWLLLTTPEPTKQSIKFTNGSVITAIPTSTDAGRSEALSLLIVDECAFIRDFDAIWTGLYPTVSEGGSAILISTPNGVGGLYHQLWTDGTAGVNEFNTIKLPWHVHPDHDQAWFDKESKNFSKRGVAQEFLCDFVSSGDTFLQPSEMDYCRDMIRLPTKKGERSIGVWIWADPVPSAKYVISADVARGDASDYSTFHVIRYDTAEVVAEFMGKVPPDKLADLIFEYGTLYNTALAVPEKNTFGYFTCVRLRDLGYKRLYYKDSGQDPYNYSPKLTDDTPGFDTSISTRPVVLGKLEEMIRNRILKIYSQRTFDQLQSFVWRGSKAQALNGGHDDLVLSLAIGSWIVSGCQSTNGPSASMTVAMLKASTIDRRDHSHVFQDINSVGPLGNGMYGVNRNNVYRPVHADGHPTLGSTNFDWLL